MKSVRSNRLLASTALGLALMFASHSGMAQQAEPQQKVDAGVPVPDTTLPPPPTAKDIGASDKQDANTPPQVAAEPKVEPKAALAPVEKAAAPEPVKPAAVASGISDQAVSDKLRDLISGKQFDRIAGRKADRAGIESFYKSHNFAPIWSHDGLAAARAKSAIDYLAHADQVGLDPADYPTPVFTSDMSADQLAEAELKLTQAALTFARHAQTGRISYTRVSSDISFKEEAPDPAQVLAKLSGSDDASKVLDAYNPPLPQFKALREKLAELRKSSTDEPKPEAKPAAPQVRVAEGKILRPGMKDERVIALRKRLDVSGDKNNPLYDDKVMEAVKAFQMSAELGSDGMLGPNTVRALNGQKVAESKHRSQQNKIDTILVNMERWRWYPRELGELHVIVNIPDFTLTLYDHDKVYWHTRIVAGKPGKTATPLTTAEMKFITVNPTWNVPPSIIENEYLPALQQDPDALER
ncbi:MAG TPA: L,D-transpeptidase family protein, partial [Pseudolabrys sp.]|nr:L,D-transpeptidase family protein [Pseudolabrys sp.]